MSNQPPIEVPQGAIRLNTDSQKLEFYAQDRWYEMATNTSNLGTGSGASSDAHAGVRGLFAGKFDDSNNQGTIDYVTISTQGNAIGYGDLSAGGTNFYGGICASQTRWVYFGGSPHTSEMDFGEFSKPGNSQDFGNLTGNTQYNPSGVSNRTRGIRMGGASSPTEAQNVIEHWTFATTGSSQDFGDLAEKKRFSMSANSPTRGVLVGGDISNGNTGVELSQFITMSTTGNAQKFGDLGTVSKGFGGNGVCSNATRGIFFGGSGYTSIISTLQMATEGNTYEFGNLSYGVGYNASTANATRALSAGGYDPNASPSNYINTIEMLNIATGGDTVDFGDRTVAGSYASGTSNGHGGL
tara:strand:- start:105 stop:1166 length:1062 start_codon:yes stop_codon:yes gene_type:complete